ncbi:hypothetical protein [Azotobacter vinelandii]|uniref:hypothetical protein n=1 Tax=Azotobacter vinelandii TaxID=354 RepID=UPI00091BD805|nr:hypothetical protein [Azotobacter vinelandii]SFY21736.1 hypothetical protein SAMN04244547_04529 [Azotobacter vinelandii]
MSSVVEICNMALSRIGNSDRIDALDEDTAQAEQCSLFYETTRDFVLRDFHWGFATAFVSLAEVSANPDPEYPYAYAMPTDCLKARRIVGNVLPESFWPCVNEGWARPVIKPIPFRVINGSSNSLIATTVTPATLEYTKKIESSELFDPVFVSAFAWRLAGQIAPSLSSNANIAQTCEAQYQAEIARAAADMLNEGVNDFTRESSFITGRGQ